MAAQGPAREREAPIGKIWARAQVKQLGRAAARNGTNGFICFASKPPDLRAQGPPCPLVATLAVQVAQTRLQNHPRGYFNLFAKL
jgi:hypothetical protein